MKQQTTSKWKESDNGVVDVVPTCKDVLFGRGRTHFFHPGNKRFRELVGMSLGEYLDAPTKSQKSMIVNRIVNEAMKQGARFLEQQANRSKCWRDVGVKRLRDKVRGTFL
jgi:hypothetical protein